jgi:hypothetical protein
MLSKCANPACFAPFRYLRDGKLFEIETQAGKEDSGSPKKPIRKVEYFWLCGECSPKLVVVKNNANRVEVKAIPGRFAALAAGF